MDILKKILLIELLFAIFLFGGVIGINVGKKDNEDKLTNTYIELDSEKEKSYQLNLENKKLNTILDNYTIEERKKDENRIIQ